MSPGSISSFGPLLLSRPPTDAFLFLPRFLFTLICALYDYGGSAAVFVRQPCRIHLANRPQLPPLASQLARRIVRLLFLFRFHELYCCCQCCCHCVCLILLPCQTNVSKTNAKYIYIFCRLQTSSRGLLITRQVHWDSCGFFNVCEMGEILCAVSQLSSYYTHLDRQAGNC